MVEITDSDVFFSTKTDFWSSGEPDGCTPFPPGSWEFSLEAVTTHEVGHLIGLGHSGDGAALMAPSISSCDAKPLDDDDRDGRDALYACTLTACAASETGFCDDGIDNDCDGVIDDCGGPVDPCGDGFCDTAAGEDSCSCVLDCGDPLGTETLFCTDGDDNDCDGPFDCDDPDCTTDPACGPPPPDCGGNKAFCTSADDCCSGNCNESKNTCRGN